MTAMAGRISDYGNNFDFRSMLESKLNEKKSQLGETEQNIKKIGGSRLGSSRIVESSGERLPSFKGRLGPVVSSRGGRSAPQTSDRRSNINSRLGPRVNSQDDTVTEGNDASKVVEDSNGFGGEVTGRGSVMSRIVVEQKSREDALAEQKVDKKENQRNKRMFGSIIGTLQQFRADETKDKDRELKKRKIEAKIDQKTEKERAEAIKQKQELFEDKKKKELEIKVLQVQMKRAEEFEIWERSKRKEQKYIRTKNSSTKIYYLPKNHNDSTLTALENTMDEIDEEIRTAREIFEEELQKISSRAEQNPNASVEDLEGDDNSGDENETDQTTKSIVSAIKKPNEEKSTNSKEVQKENRHLVSQANRKIKDMNRIANRDERSIENGVKNGNDNEDAKSGHRNNIDKKVNSHDDSNMSSAEKSKEGNSDTINNRNDAHTEPEIGIRIIPEVESDSNDTADIKKISNDNPIKDISESNGRQDSNSKSKRSESSRTYSPDSNERKKRRSGSYNDNLQNSRALRDESSGKSKRKDIKDSSRLDEKEKRHKQSKKKRDSSSDSSSNSSSSDDQSDSDKSSTNSSSYSDSSDSSSDSDAKKKSKKQNSKKSRSKKLAREKEKDKKSSNIRRSEGRVSRKKSGRKSSIQKHSDSSD